MRHADVARLANRLEVFLPIHDYVCSNCGYSIEVMHSVHSQGPDVCPKCGGPMKKTLAVPSVHYKGTGWARKDRSTASRAGKTVSKDSGSRGTGSTSGDTSGSVADSGSDSSSTPAPAAAPAPSKEPD